MTQIPTEAEIRLALERDRFYGQLPQRIIVPKGYNGPRAIDGITVEAEDDVDDPYIVPAEGGRLGFDGCELASAGDVDAGQSQTANVELLARTINQQVFTSIAGIRRSG